MDQLSLCWRGPSGTGKRTKLVEALKRVAGLRGIPFSIQMKADTVAVGDITESAAEEGMGPDDTGQFMHETSLVHIGLDVARMSMQDKNILRPVLAKFGQGSQVLAGAQGRACRILVLYHAHLLSSESVLLLHACLEQNEGDLSIWLTSELPVPQRIRDWFIEIPVAGIDRSFAVFKASAGGVHWPDIFRAIIDKWRRAPPPKLHDIKEVKSYVYEMLMRNLRWVEATHFLLDAILCHTEITDRQRSESLKILASCDATGGGYTIPSYRIPILWESVFIQLRSIFSDKVSHQVDARPKRASAPRKKSVAAAAGRVVGV